MDDSNNENIKDIGDTFTSFSWSEDNLKLKNFDERDSGTKTNINLKFKAFGRLFR